MKKIIYAVLIIPAVFFAPGRAYAEDLKLSLADCLVAGMANNLQLASMRQKINARHHEVGAAFGAFLPSVELSGSLTMLNEAPSIEIMRQKIEVGQVDNYSGRLTVTEPVFTWGKRTNAYRLARIMRDIADLSHQRMVQEVSADIKKLFYLTLAAGEMEKSLKETEQSLTRHKDQIKTMYENGTASKFDYLRSDVALASLKPQIARAGAGIESSLLAMKTLLGVDKPVTLAGEMLFAEVREELEYFLNAGQKRLDLLALEKQKEISDLSVKLQDAADKPSVVALWNYQQQRPYQTVDEWGSSWNAVLAVNYPLFDGFSSRKKTAAARANDFSLGLDIKAFRSRVDLDIRTAFLVIMQEKTNLALQDRIIEQSKEALRIATERYNAGLITNLEYMDSEMSLNQAKMNKIQATANYLAAVINLEKSSGIELIK